MPLVAAALLEPQGALTSDLFPGDDATALTARLAAYLDAGYARADAAATPPSGADRDDYARAWAYGRAYGAAYQRMTTAAATLSVDGEVSRSFLITQIQNVRDLRDAAVAQAAAILAGADPGTTPTDATRRGPPASASSSLTFSW